MRTSKPQPPAQSPRERAAWIVLVVLVVGGAVVLLWSLRKPPQMGADADVFNTVDALYTAVRNRDEKRLKKCEERLSSYRQDGKLPDAPARYLDDVIATARGGDWSSAAKSLYDFMIAQRREGEKQKHK